MFDFGLFFNLFDVFIEGMSRLQRNWDTGKPTSILTTIHCAVVHIHEQHKCLTSQYKPCGLQCTYIHEKPKFTSVAPSLWSGLSVKAFRWLHFNRWHCCIRVIELPINLAMTAWFTLASGSSVVLWVNISSLVNFNFVRDFTWLKDEVCKISLEKPTTRWWHETAT